LRSENILLPFDEFDDKKILTPRERQNYQSKYLDIKTEIDKYKPDKESIANDVVFEIELIKQFTVNIDYILLMIEEHITNKKSRSLQDIISLLDSRPELRSKKELVLEFINNITSKSSSIVACWQEYSNKKKTDELEQIIKLNNLDNKKTIQFIDYCFENGEIKDSGKDFDAILPAISLFDDNGQARAIKKAEVLDEFKVFFEKYFF